MKQGTLPQSWCSGATQRDGVGGIGWRWEGDSGRRGHMYTYGQFILMYGKNCNNIVVILQLK